VESDNSFTFLEGPFTDEQTTAERVRALCPVEIGDQWMITLGGSARTLN
jgi:hypothetical protein